MRQSPSLWRKVEAAVAAGAAATAAMTVFMKAWQKAVPEAQNRPAPPRQVTKGITEKAGVWQRLPPQARTALTWVSHFGFGTTMALAYAGTASRLPAPKPAAGALFGVGVWASSYAGWLPALDILAPPQEKPKEQTTQLVAAHLVWGSVLGASYAALAPRPSRVPRQMLETAPGGSRMPEPSIDTARRNEVAPSIPD